MNDVQQPIHSKAVGAENKLIRLAPFITRRLKLDLEMVKIVEMEDRPGICCGLTVYGENKRSNYQLLPDKQLAVKVPVALIGNKKLRSDGDKEVWLMGDPDVCISINSALAEIQRKLTKML